MLTTLYLKNFKGFRDLHEIPLAPITLIFGQNSSGKSALLQALAVMAQSVPQVGMGRPKFSMSGSFVDLGGFENVIHGHDERREMQIGFQSTNEELPTSAWTDSTTLGQNARVIYTLSKNRMGQIITSEKKVGVTERNNFSVVPNWEDPAQSHINIDRDTFSVLAGQIQDDRNTYIEFDEDDSNSYFEWGEDEFSSARELIVNSTDVNEALERINSRSSYVTFRSNEMWTHDGIHGGYKKSSAHEDLRPPLDKAILLFLAEIFERSDTEIKRSLSNFSYLGPMRAAPQRIEDPHALTSVLLSPDGQGITSQLYNDSNLQAKVNETLMQIGVPYSIEARRISNETYPTVGEHLALQLTDARSGVPVSLKDVGYGVSQLLPVAVHANRRGSGALVVEQPELHLHPRLQGNLAEFLAGTSTKRQVIVETHSENIILRIQKLVRIGALDPWAVSIIYVGADTVSGSGSWIEPIGLNEDGEMTTEWPDGFFEERLEDY